MEPHLVLGGGGHAHVEVLRRLAGQPHAGLRATLVNPEEASLYSGMMPGLIAGHYSRVDCEINLVRLCQSAGARLILGSVAAVDPEARALRLSTGSTLHWDLLSLNTGSEPDLASVTGAERFAIPVKPMSGFMKAWDRALDEGLLDSKRPFDAVVVGAGAGGVEVAMAIQHRLREAGGSPRVTLASEHFLEGYPEPVRGAVRRALARAQVESLEGVRATAVTESSVSFSGGQNIESRFTVWAIGASAPGWVGQSGLARDARGFLAVDACLRSRSDPTVFAAGDIASLETPVPKAGVYAVRLAPVLAFNLIAACQGAPLREYDPQPRFLSLISLGERRAIASWGPLRAEGAMVWRVKDHIDRKFMQRYANR
jgi:selenide,water dikinase